MQMIRRCCYRRSFHWWSFYHIWFAWTCFWYKNKQKKTQGALVRRFQGADGSNSRFWLVQWLHPIHGIFFGNVGCTRLNWEAKMHKINNNIAASRHRELSYNIKALVINSLLASTQYRTTPLYYRCVLGQYHRLNNHFMISFGPTNVIMLQRWFQHPSFAG